jgi:hypothetical protein
MKKSRKGIIRETIPVRSKELFLINIHEERK